MIIVIFGDIHGKFLLLAKLVDKLQEKRNIKIDLILQCGDAAIFPDINKLDRASKKHAGFDDNELGFSQYLTKQKPSEFETIMKEKIKGNIICVRGNHEDHNYLDSLENKSSEPIFPVDVYKRVYVLKTGERYNFTSNNESVKILGIGRIGQGRNKSESKYIQEYEKEKLKKYLKLNGLVDILITHDSPFNFVTKNCGMKKIDEFIMINHPSIYFYSHTGKPYELRMYRNNVTEAYKVAELEWNRNNLSLPYGSLLLLTWKDSIKNKVEVIYDDWFKEYNFYNWKDI